MGLKPVLNQGPYLFLPLHGFGTNKDVLEFSKGVQICSYDETQFELLLEPWAAVRDYLRVHPAEYLVQARPPNAQLSLQMGDAADAGGIGISMFVSDEWYKAADSLVRSLRLFKPGHFTRGPKFLCLTKELPAELRRNSRPPALSCCMNYIPWDEEPPSGPQEVAYFFDAVDLDCFKRFNVELSTAFARLQNFDKLALADKHFNASFAEKGSQSQILDIFACLEALLLENADELTFRLATRMANLLGADADERRKLSSEVKDFYKVRSRIVHGEILKPKETQLLGQVGRLRELARRVILSCVALSLDVEPGTDLFASLDAMSFDEKHRSKVQEKASKFFFMHKQ